MFCSLISLTSDEGYDVGVVNMTAVFKIKAVPTCLKSVEKKRGAHLHPHVSAVFLQLLPHLLSSQSGRIQHQMLPLDGLEDVRVVRHIQADLHLGGAAVQIKHTSTHVAHLLPRLPPSSYLLQGVLVSLVGALELRHQFSQRAVRQRLVHQVLASAHAERAVAAVAVDAQHDVVEAVPRKLGLKADGETLERRQAVGQVAGQRLRIWGRAGRGGGVYGPAHVSVLECSYYRCDVIPKPVRTPLDL